MKLKREEKSLYFTDMSKCLPKQKLAGHSKEHILETVDYRSSNVYAPVPGCINQWSRALMKPDVKSPRTHFSGKAVVLAPSAAVQEVTYPLPGKGWHAIFFGLAQGSVRVRLSTDKAFCTFSKGGPDGKGFEEVFFTFKKLGGEKLVFATDAQSRKAVVAYIKLVPVDADEISLHHRSFPPGKRNLTTTLDGFCISAGWVNSHEKLKDVFEPFRNSPFGMMYWGIPYGGTALHYDESVRKGKPVIITGSVKSAAGGEQDYPDRSIREFYASGKEPLSCAVECAHDVGMKIHFYQRPGFFYTSRSHAVPFYRDNPQWHLRHKDGTPLLGRLSIVYPEVRNYLNEILKESLKHHPDGINLCFVRGAPLVAYEQRAVEEFEAQYHADPRKLKKDDERFLDFRCDCTTRFVGEVRSMLDKEGKKRRRKFELSVLVFGDKETNRFVGLDPETWARQSLVDIINPYQSPGGSAWGGRRPEIDLAYFKPLLHFPLRVVPFASFNIWEDGDVVVRRVKAIYKCGYEGFASWDTACPIGTERSRYWQTLKKLGDKNRLGEIVEGEWLPRIGYFSQFDGFGWDKDYLFGAG